MKRNLHLSGYQARDFDVVDYHMRELDGTGIQIRGPIPETLAPGSFFTCIGAAQTFGCLVQKPFPALLSEKIGLPVLNLGYGGAGPEFFAEQDQLFPIINRSRFVIVQVMSARSQSNSVFASDGLELLTRRSDGRQFGANQAYRELLLGCPPASALPRTKIGRHLARLRSWKRVRGVIAETRSNWVEATRRLAAQLTPPSVLFWFSKRRPAYRASPRNITALFGEFPQLVDAETLSAARQCFPHYAQCITDRGAPEPLVNRFNGGPATINPSNDRPDLDTGVQWTVNHYYPSSQMHEDAAEALHPLARKLAVGLDTP